ncbi:hypothetical protein PVAP13_2KG268374 [Panicum virgatum]|uniref:Uncharacterized protein n=1 Tax=Panicum virgatum TaxID=38727 RepID=A0A8T0W3S4_PANVG|nr:hypothetical protein PVAP13_2KG268374 [Panicum virgatum]
MLLLLAFLSTAVGTPTTFRDHPCENYSGGGLKTCFL